MDQTEARQIARQVGGIACTEDTYRGLFDKTFRWGVGLNGRWYADQSDIPPSHFVVGTVGHGKSALLRSAGA